MTFQKMTFPRLVSTSAIFGLAILITAVYCPEEAEGREIPTVSLLLQTRTGASVISVPGSASSVCPDCYYVGTAGAAIDVVVSPIRAMIPSRLTSADWLGFHFKMAINAAFDNRGALGGTKTRTFNSRAVEHYPWIAPGDIQFELGLLFSVDGNTGNHGAKLGVSWAFGTYFGAIQGNGLGFLKGIVDFQYLRIANTPLGLGVGLEIPFFLQGEQGLYNPFKSFSPNTHLQAFHVPWQIVFSLSIQFDLEKGFLPDEENE